MATSLPAHLLGPAAWSHAPAWQSPLVIISSSNYCSSFNGTKRCANRRIAVRRCQKLLYFLLARERNRQFRRSRPASSCLVGLLSSSRSAHLTTLSLAFLLLQFRPSRIQGVHSVLRFFQLCLCPHQTWTVAGDCRVF